jgi:hypothetical protein
MRRAYEIKLHNNQTEILLCISTSHKIIEYFLIITIFRLEFVYSVHERA